MTKIHFQTGDLTELQVEAIVNAANNDLILGSGLAGAIARKGGPDIQAACTEYGPIEVGQAAITPAGKLPADFVIHQASMRLGGKTTAESLRQSTQAVLQIAEDNRVRTLGFPATGTGVAGFPIDQCARIMLEEVKKHVAGITHLTDVYFVLFDEDTSRVFQETWKKIQEEA